MEEGESEDMLACMGEVSNQKQSGPHARLRKNLFEVRGVRGTLCLKAALSPAALV